ncbi:MAG: antibiotic biosynthesis monooxygenase [Nocardioides sp.]|nr:antibiotic biosynthesis monooxygenase [Nocardioides sp.]
MSDLPANALRVVATIPTDPAHGDTVRAGLADLVAATRQEDGCLAYDAFESTEAPGTFVTVEAWTSQADLDAHMATPHIATAFEVLGAALTGEVSIHPLAPLG